MGRSNILQTSSNDSPPAEDIVTNNWSLSSRFELNDCSLSSRLLIKGPSLLNRTGLMDLWVSLKVSWLSLTLLKGWSLLVPKIQNKYLTGTLHIKGQATITKALNNKFEIVWFCRVTPNPSFSNLFHCYRCIIELIRCMNSIYMSISPPQILNIKQIPSRSLNPTIS